MRDRTRTYDKSPCKRDAVAAGATRTLNCYSPSMNITITEKVKMSIVKFILSHI